jgi:acyl-CoA thioesterase-2
VLGDSSRGGRLDYVGGEPPALTSEGADVLSILNLEQIGDNHFLGRYNRRNVNAALYGGQVVAQALMAAAQTADGRPAHSLHAYFIRPGSADTSVTFLVDRIRDGRNFTTRRVSALQNGRHLLELICSFAQPQHGFSHQTAMPDLPPPEGLDDLAEIARKGGDDLPDYLHTFDGPVWIELRPFTRSELIAPTGVARRDFWLRVPSAAGMDPARYGDAVVAYLSDFWLASAALMPHSHPCPSKDLFVASLDHSVWFHRPLEDASDWLLYHIDSPNAGNGVNLSRGLLFDRKGRLIASTAQEALQLPS